MQKRVISLEKGMSSHKYLNAAFSASFFCSRSYCAYPFTRYKSNDYNTYLLPWYNYIKAHGGFAALKDNFSDYNPPYLYLLAFATYLPVDPLIAVKSISVVFDSGASPLHLPDPPTEIRNESMTSPIPRSNRYLIHTHRFYQ